MQALSPTQSPYGATNARNQIRNKSALESRGSGAASFLDHTLLRVEEIYRLSLTQAQKAPYPWSGAGEKIPRQSDDARQWNSRSKR